MSLLRTGRGLQTRGGKDAEDSPVPRKPAPAGQPAAGGLSPSGLSEWTLGDERLTRVCRLAGSWERPTKQAPRPTLATGQYSCIQSLRSRTRSFSTQTRPPLPRAWGRTPR